MLLRVLIQASGFQMKVIWIHLQCIQLSNMHMLLVSFYSSFAFFQLCFEQVIVKTVPCIAFLFAKELRCDTLFLNAATWLVEQDIFCLMSHCLALYH